MMRFRQKGENPKYPEVIECWRSEEEYVPEWLANQARIIGMRDDGTPVLSIIATNTGGYEIIEASGGALVKTQNNDDYVCYAEGYRIFSLTTKQMEHLYVEATGKKRNK